MLYQDYIRVLHIDMQNERVRIDERKDLTKYLGGVGVAAKLLEEHMRPDLPPLAPEQPIVFAIGALSTIFPVISKSVAMFISPLTGELGESYAGGRMAMTMFEAGYDAMVIVGKSRQPTYLTIYDNDIHFRDARAIWKQEAESTGRIIREYEVGHNGKRTILRIGPAGENMIAYACVTVDTYRHFGRLGLGAVFGSKYLKAINMVGGRSIPIRDVKQYFKVYRELYDKATAPGGAMAKYHDIGTPVNIEPLNLAGALPTLNMQEGRFDDAERLSGEAFAEKHLVRKMSCVGCPVGCIHIGQFRRAFSEIGYEYETVAVAYDYELIFALGTFLGLSRKRQVLELVDRVEECGMDAMSTGVALGWATEALKNGLITIEDTIEPLEFGEHEPYKMAIHHLTNKSNKFYSLLGKGVRQASKIYGGKEYAMHIAGNEMSGYHTGYGSLVGMAVGARHSHLDNGGYSIDQSMSGEKVDVDVMAKSLLDEEIERCMLNSLIMCLFARKVYERDNILRALTAIGYYLTDKDLTAIGRRNLLTKLRIKKALGFSLKSIRLPKRFFETPSMNGILDEATAKEIIKRYDELISELEE